MPLSPGYSLRRTRPDDISTVHRLVTAVETAEFGEATGFSEDDLRDEVEHKTTWVATDPDGDIAGYAAFHERRHVRMDVEGYVHPDHHGRGIGAAIIETTEALAAEHLALAPPEARVVLHNWINAHNADATALLERAGYQPVRYFLEMHRELDATPEVPEWPEGIGVREMIPNEDERRFHQVIQEAWADHWGFVPQDFQAWWEEHERDVDPTLWFLAVDGEEPAGIARCRVADGIGWVSTLAVRRAWRGRGLGMALLRHSAVTFHARGLKRMALGVDSESPSGADRLYVRAGMHEAQRHATFGKTLRDGVDLVETEDAPAPA